MGYEIRREEAAFGNYLWVVYYNGESDAIFTSELEANAYVLGAVTAEDRAVRKMYGG